MSMIGKSLVHYEVSAQIGKGGMGEVYQATDKKLGREVAIKVLPEEFALDTDRVARFQREAKLLASLNHPNIAAIHGLEESEGIHFLVMELIEGDTLRDRIKSGPIPVEEALKLALQMAEALEAAHDKGVIHRDLKPANIKVTPDGKVKVLDFGLAKAYVGDQENLSPMDSPTLSVAATRQGVILGTAAYMSPEQAKGKIADNRTDIWAFGCVLYEMLIGQPAFQGEDVTEILASVVKADVDMNRVPANIHPDIRKLLTRCLQKEQKRRYSGISDVQYEMEQVLADPSGIFVKSIPTAKPRKKVQVGLPWLVAFIIASIIIALALGWNLKPTEPLQVTRFYYEPKEDQQLGDLEERALTVSPDGSQFIYKTEGGLYLRPIGELDARLISGTEENPQKPFFSSDGQWIGYVSGSDRKLKKISINGGAPVPLGDIDSAGFLSWGKDDTIVYASGSNIMRISANGGNPELLVEGTGESCFAPQVLPDGKTVMFTLGPAPYKILLQSLESGERKELIAAGDTAQFLKTGHIVYGVNNNLFARPFDLEKLELTGGPIPMVEGVLRVGGAPQYAVSDSGTLVYMPGTSSGASGVLQRTLAWVDREGKEEPITAPPNEYNAPRISPDGTRVALEADTSANVDIWVWDFVRETMSRLTFDEAIDGIPLWTPDGKRIVFGSNREGSFDIYWKAADGTGETELLGSIKDRTVFPASWSADGNTIVLMDGLGNIATLSMEEDRELTMLLQDEGDQSRPQVSPDGRWMSYMSDESGRSEIFIRPFPEVNNGKWQVSRGGGTEPIWSRDGSELFYRSGDAIMLVSVKTEPSISLETPKMLFRGERVYLSNSFFTYWDIHPDGKRFLMIKEPISGVPREGRSGRTINIVLNWDEELKQRVPVD